LGAATFVHRRLGFKRFLYVAMLLLCTGDWVLRVFFLSRCYFCAQALGFSEFFSCRDATFVHRRLGFKRFLYIAMLLLCTGACVLRGFSCGNATFVHRRMGFK
jgi:cyanate permease